MKISKEEQFTRMYNENFDYVFSFIFTRTSCDAQITEEIVQETFTSAWLAHDKFQHKSRYRTWLCAIAKNKLFEHYRKKISQEKKQLSEIDNLEEYADDFQIDSTVLNFETKTQVQEALKRLNSIYRYSLIMKYIDGYSVREIARQLNRTEKAIDGVLQKAKNNFIKEYLKLEKRDLHER